MAYIRVRPRNRRRNNECETRVKSYESRAETTGLATLCTTDQLIPQFYPNEPNLINTSPELMATYKRQQQVLEQLRHNKKLKRNDWRRYDNSCYIESNGEPFYTVLVRVKSSPENKPTKQEVFKNLRKFGRIEDIVVESVLWDSLYLFVRFDKSEEALDLYNKSNKVRLNYRNQKNISIEVIPKPFLCAVEGIDSVAEMLPIDGQLVVETIKSAETKDKYFDVLRDQLLLSETDLKKRQQLVNILESILIESKFYCKFHVFGSTNNRLGFCDSDIDVFIHVMDKNNFDSKISPELAIRLLDQIKRLLTNRLKMYIRPQIRSKRCPLLRLDFRHFADSLRSTGLTVDLSLIDSLGIRNSELIAFYCRLEPRFQSLAIVLRYLAKINGFIGSNQMSSYGFSLLIIYFFQTRSPPLLPTVQQMLQKGTKSQIINGIETGFCDDLNVYRNRELNDSTITQLFKDFFIFYSTFDFKNKVISPRFGGTVRKDKYDKHLEKHGVKQSNGQLFRLTDLCCIQDPFDLYFNVCHHMPYSLFIKLTEYMRKRAIDSDNYFDENDNNFMDLFNVCQTEDVLDLEANYDSDDNYEKENDIQIVETIVKPYIGQHSIGKVIANFASKPSTHDLEVKLNEMTERITNFFRNIFKKGFQMKCFLLKHSAINLGQNSTFAKFIFSSQRIDKIVINAKNRKSALISIGDRVKGLCCVDSEALITEAIIKNEKNCFNTNQCLAAFQIEVELSLNTETLEMYLNVRAVEGNQTTDSKDFVDFICQTIRSRLASEELLVIDDDIFIIPLSSGH